MVGETPAAQPSGLRLLLVDDERPALEELAYLVRRDPAVRQAVAVNSAEEALRHIATGGFDAVLTDIKMPGVDGLALTRALLQLRRPPCVVFVTAHEEHAVAAFTLDVTDYLLKPVRPERLARALGRVVAVTGVGARPTATDPASDPAPDLLPDERIAIDSVGVTRFVVRSSVEWVAAHGDYVRLHSRDGSYLLRSPISVLEQRWRAGRFLRIHRSVLVNLAHIREVHSNDGRASVVMTSGRTLPVSRRQARELRAALRGEVTTGDVPG